MNKLIIAIINDEDSAAVEAHLTREYYTVTKLATEGSYLQAGNTTFLIGSDEKRIARAKEIIKEHCVTRKKAVDTENSFGRGLGAGAMKTEVNVHGATVFVLDVSDMEKY